MIPVCIPTLGEAEMVNVADCLERGWISAQGEYVTEFEEAFADYCGVGYGVTTTSGTTALHLALEALEIGPGDEVIVPAFTMGASAFAVSYTGADPVLVDADPETWTMDPAAVAAAVTDDTAAIMPVHVYGHPCDMAPIREIADEHDLAVIEDAAEAHGATYRGETIGSVGDVACFSFYANKLVTTGEGGMVVTDDPELAERLDWLHDLAYGADDRFVHDEVGFNYRMTNVQAAIGCAQLDRLDELVEMRRENARLYDERLADVPGVERPVEKEWATNVHWMYGITLGESFPLSRDALQAALQERGIETRRFFVPMHEQPAYRDRGQFQDASFPVAEDLAERGLYLPSSSHLDVEEIDEVTDAIREVHAEAVPVDPADD